MKLDKWLQGATTTLKNAGIETARLDCLVLLEDATKHDRAWLLAHPEHTLQPAEVAKLKTWIERRAAHEPLAYIRGKAEFYGYEFAVTSDVLVPRPESEAMIELLVSYLATKKGHTAPPTHLIDIGTGSGCLAITAKQALPHLIVAATDIDPVCLAVAQKNAQNLHTDITFHQADLLDSLSLAAFPPAQTILLANLPYVPDKHPINRAATHEPPKALFGGDDGLDAYRQLFDQMMSRQFPASVLITESLASQHDTLAALALTYHYQLKASHDLAQLFIV